MVQEEGVEVVAGDGQKKNILSYINPKENLKGFFFFIVAIIIAGAGITFAAYNVSKQGSTNNNRQTQKAVNEPFEPISDNSVVYGFWEGDLSKIRAADLKSGEIYSLGDFPSNIKKVTVASNSELIFISNTNIKDHGTAISSYQIKDKTTSEIVKADSEYGIDDYVVSPDKRYIATWEISIPQEATELTGGRSRVNTVDLQNPGTKHLIYDETIGALPVHYPVAILNTGEVILDTFKANSSAGWANGMSVSNLTGSDKQDIVSMPSGSYSSQPVLSADGTYLVFAGYDGSLGPGNTEISDKDGFRQAILNPNTVGLLNTATKERTELPLPKANRYTFVDWDRHSGKIIYKAISKNPDESGLYLIGTAVGESPARIRAGINPGLEEAAIVSTLPNSKLLAVIQEPLETATGNLGEKYSQIIRQISVIDDTSNTKTILNINNLQPIQYIDLLPGGAFSGGEVTAYVRPADAKADSLQLNTFTIKPVLLTRTSQQSQTACRNVAAERCNAMLGTNFYGLSRSEYASTNSEEFNQCFSQQFSEARQADICSDSPLYLYGKRGTSVKVVVGAEISGSSAPYKNGYSGILTGDGGINISGNNYPSIDFNYVPALRMVKKPDYGKSVKSQELGIATAEYGKKLGLTEREVNDLVSSIGEINAPYVFVSFYSDEYSKAMLPISFSPAPDVYRNIVFYLRPMNEPIEAKSPVFSSYPQRTGFTAVEVSYFIDN